MTSHRILITTEYLNAHFISVFLSVYTLQVLEASFCANFRKRSNSPVYSAPPCSSEDMIADSQTHTHTHTHTRTHTRGQTRSSQYSGVSNQYEMQRVESWCNASIPTLALVFTVCSHVSRSDSRRHRRANRVGRYLAKYRRRKWSERDGQETRGPHANF